MRPTASLVPLIALGLVACDRPSAPAVAERWRPVPSATAPAPAVPTRLVQEGTYWPFARLPTQIGDVGQGSTTTVFAAVPGGTCIHWNCSVTFSLSTGCHGFTPGDDPCVFGVYLWQTVFDDKDLLSGPSVALHRGVVGHRRAQGVGFEGPTITWPASLNGMNELWLRSGREEHLVTLANALIDAGF